MKTQAYRSLLILLCALFYLTGFSQTNAAIPEKSHKWFIALPLRFTHLQNDNTMLSGIKIGREVYPKLSTAISVYHSFYLQKFKSPAQLIGYSTQPRLFINCFGLEVDYRFIQTKHIDAGIQLLCGWGFMNYELKKDNFKSKQVNYPTLEPVLGANYHLNHSTSLSIGLGYRAILSKKNINYTSNISSGVIPIQKNLPNGILLALTLKGKF